MPAGGEGAGLLSPTEAGGDGEGNPGFSGAWVAGQDRNGASGEAVCPKPVYGAGLDVREADQISLAGGGWGCIA